MAEQRRRQGLLDGGQLPEIVVAHQEQALPGLQPVQGPHQGVQPPGEQHHPVRAPGVGPLPLQAQVQGRFPELQGPVVPGEEIEEAAQARGQGQPGRADGQVKGDFPGPGVGGDAAGQKLVRGPDSQGRQQEGRDRLTRQPGSCREPGKIVVQGITGLARLIQVNDRGHPRRRPAFFVRGPQVEFIGHGEALRTKAS